MDEQEIWKIANKRAGYALATIADHQMSTWLANKPIDGAKYFIALQVTEAMNDVLSERKGGIDDAMIARALAGFDTGTGDPNDYRKRMRAALEAALQTP